MVYQNILQRTAAATASRSRMAESSISIHRRSLSQGFSFQILQWNRESNNKSLDTTLRSKHSSTQIKRLFKKNPAKRRIALKQDATTSLEKESIIPQATLTPLVPNPKIFSNGWNPPFEETPGDESIPNAITTRPDYPFRISRTKNKPNHAVGFLPVYSEFRKDGARVTTRIKKVTGDRDFFLNELRAALQIPIPSNPKEDEIRIRTGGTIEIKGNRVLEVKTWLAGLGF